MSESEKQCQVLVTQLSVSINGLRGKAGGMDKFCHSVVEWLRPATAASEIALLLVHLNLITEAEHYLVGNSILLMSGVDEYSSPLVNAIRYSVRKLLTYSLISGCGISSSCHAAIFKGEEYLGITVGTSAYASGAKCNESRRRCPMSDCKLHFRVRRVLDAVETGITDVWVVLKDSNLHTCSLSSLPSSSPSGLAPILFSTTPSPVGVSSLGNHESPEEVADECKPEVVLTDIGCSSRINEGGLLCQVTELSGNSDHHRHDNTKGFGGGNKTDLPIVELSDDETTSTLQATVQCRQTSASIRRPLGLRGRREVRGNETFIFRYPRLDCGFCCFTGSNLLTMPDDVYLGLCATTDRWFDTDFMSTLAVMLAHANHSSKIRIIHGQDENGVMKPKRGFEKLETEVETVLSLIYLEKHYCVMKVTVGEKRVEIFDAGSNRLLAKWKKQILNILAYTRLIAGVAKMKWNDKQDLVILDDQVGDCAWTVQFGNFISQDDGASSGPIAMLKIMHELDAGSIDLGAMLHPKDYRQVVVAKFRELAKALGMVQ